MDLQNSARADIVRAVVSTAQRTNRYALTGTGVNEVAVTDVNADMRRAVSVGAEEDQIAGNKLSRGNWRTDFVLNIGSARQGNARFGEDVLHVTRTIKAVRSRAAEDVRNADIIH